MTHRPPRYDLPNAAPEPLRAVQLFVNTINLERGDEWLRSWLEERGVHPDGAVLARARTVREAIRELLYAEQPPARRGRPVSGPARRGGRGRALDRVRRAGARARAAGVHGALGRVVAVSFTAMADGSWRRLKACRNHDCRWAFYDHSKNRSASWCSMQLCGNRVKARACRARLQSGRR